MSDLTQEEQQFFESGGETAVDAPEAEVVIEQQSETLAESEQLEQEPAAQEQEQQREAPRMVPIDALHEARAQAKELKAQVAQLSAERQKFEQWKSQIEQRLNPQEQVPAFDENPAENLRHEVTSTKAKLEAFERQAQAQAQEQQFSTWYQAQAAQFTQKQPDFMEAYSAVISARTTELDAQGLSPQQIRDAIKREEQMVAVSAAQMGINPAQMMYHIALSKGYKPKTEQLKQDSSQKIQAVSDGIKSSRTVSNVAGKATGGLTIEYILSLPEAEQQKYLDNWDETMSKVG